MTSQYGRSSMSLGGPVGSRRYLTQMADVNGNTVSVTYDAASGTVRTNSVSDNRGHTVIYLRTGDGSAVSGLQDQDGRTASYGYDATGRMVVSIDNAGKAMSYGYDSNNLITSVTDPNGNVTTIEYDEFRRVYSVTQAGLRWAFGYYLDASGVCAESSVTPPLTRTFVVPPDLHTATFCPDDEGPRQGDSRRTQPALLPHGPDQPGGQHLSLRLRQPRTSHADHRPSREYADVYLQRRGHRQLVDRPAGPGYGIQLRLRRTAD